MSLFRLQLGVSRHPMPHICADWEHGSPLTVAGVLSHLHSVHRYPLLDCLCDDNQHNHLELELLPTLIAGHMFLYSSDLEKIKSHENGHRLYANQSMVCIRESCRKSPARSASVAHLEQLLASASTLT